jgi:hypothetical protein
VRKTLGTYGQSAVIDKAHDTQQDQVEEELGVQDREHGRESTLVYLKPK